MEAQQEKKQSNNTSLVKWLMTSIVGTTISIALTFGTSHIIENQKKNVEGRQAAMMVIHDMESYAELFRSLAEKETASHDLAVYVLDHLDNLNELSEDTLKEVAYYITNTDEVSYTIDESTEKTFLSSQDIWRNIKTPLFIDVVQNFFLQRHLIFDELNNGPIYRKPIQISELLEMIVNSRDQNYHLDYAGYLKKHLRDNHILYYLDQASSRLHSYKIMADEWQNMSDQCKFMMNISDEELKGYLTQRKRTGTPLKEQQLIGKWKIPDNKIPQYYEFNKDHTFVQTVIQSQVGSLFSGTLRYIFTYKGQWSIKGDTLYRYYEPEVNYKLDDSQITVIEQMRDSVNRLLSQYRDALSQNQKQNTPHAPIIRCARIDKSGNKIELSWTGPDENDKETDQTSYFIRLKNDEK